MRKNILIIYDYYYPAFKAGGPIQSIFNLVLLLKPKYSFRILTSNKDLGGELLPVKYNEWINNSSEIFYAGNILNIIRAIFAQIQKKRISVVYMNGLFSSKYFILPFFIIVTYKTLVIKKFQRIKIVLAPRGMLLDSALGQKSIKKKLLLIFIKPILKKFIHTWHITNPQEFQGVKKFAGKNAEIVTIGNVPKTLKTIKPKKLGENIELITVALISPIKNITLVINALKNLNVEKTVDYTFFGPVKDVRYMHEINLLIKDIPQNIKVKYGGILDPSEVPSEIGSNHFYVQPSQSENFGHSIFEALSVGRPVITSYNTPWNNLKQFRAGWNIDISNHYSLLKVLYEITDMQNDVYTSFCLNAHEYSTRFIRRSQLEDKYSNLFG